MDIKRYARRLQAVLAEARNVAASGGNTLIESVHFLFALLQEKENPAVNMLSRAGMDIHRANHLLLSSIDDLPKVSGDVDNVKMSRKLADVLRMAERAADELGDSAVSLNLALITLARQNLDNSEATKIMMDAGLSVESLVRIYEEMRKVGEGEDSDVSKGATEMIDQFTVDLTEKARKGELDPVIGRDDEIRRIIQILQRRRKNNPVIIGEAGVGKTALVEGLALRIVDGEVADVLKDKRILVLDMSSLVAGAKFRGEFEERLKNLLKEITARQDEIILFIDEIHTMVSAGKGEGSMDAGNMLKPALSRGELRCIGATTLDEYREKIEKDPALERRFQKVLANEPTEAETIAILRGLKERYEVHHRVEITDDAIIASAKLSNRYIADRQLPDKAIDLLDEAGSMLRTEIDSKPEAVDKIERRLTQLRLEEENLKNEKGEEATRQLQKVLLEVESVQKEFDELSATLEKEKAYLADIAKTKKELEDARNAMDEARRQGDFAKMSELQYGTIPTLEGKIKDAEERAPQMQLIRTRVTNNEIAIVVARSTGIPVDRMMESEKDRLLHLEDHLHERVIGQSEAITAVSNAVRRARAGISDPSRPNGSFLFLGPTGVGKTELCKALSTFLFDTEDATIRMDMSEYMEKHSVARLIGAPPGYVGHEEGGRLTEAVRRRPYSLVLFDEVEKAHGDVFNILLQVLDDGRLTDSQGRVVDFKNTVVVMTSNLGADSIQELYGNSKAAQAKKMMEEAKAQAKGEEVKETEDEGANLDSKEGDGQPAYSEMKAVVMEAVEKHFRPEFINRIDEVVVFHPLQPEQIRAIAGYQIRNLNERLEEQDIQVALSEEAFNHISQLGFDPLYGARPLRRVIQQWLENPLAQYIIAGVFKPGMLIHVDVVEDSLSFSVDPDSDPETAISELEVDGEGGDSD